MDVLDADDRRLGIEGRYAERDIVQVCCFFMPPKELWEAYSNRTVRPSIRPSVRVSVPLSCPVHISYIL